MCTLYFFLVALRLHHIIHIRWFIWKKHVFVFNRSLFIGEQVWGFAVNNWSVMSEKDGNWFSHGSTDVSSGANASFFPASAMRIYSKPDSGFSCQQSEVRTKMSDHFLVLVGLITESAERIYWWTNRFYWRDHWFIWGKEKKITSSVTKTLFRDLTK